MNAEEQRQLQELLRDTGPRLETIERNQLSILSKLDAVIQILHDQGGAVYEGGKLESPKKVKKRSKD